MVGLLKQALGGFEYIYMAIDKFTKWIDYKPLIKFNAAKVVEFIQDIMHRFGMPNQVITDLGSPFTAIEFRSWAQNCGISINYVLVFLNVYINNPQVRGITVVAFHPKVFRVSYFHEKRMCKCLLASSPKITRRKIARVARFFRDRDPMLR
jgi:hypothetical protein